MRDTQEQGPTADALTRAPLIVAQPQLLYFVEVDFNLDAARVDMDGGEGIKGEIGTEQVPGGENKAGDGDNYDAGWQSASRPHAAQQDFGIRDLNGSCPAPDVQDRRLLAQALGALRGQPSNPTRGAEDARATLTGRAAAWGEVNALITAQAAQRTLALGSQSAHQRATQNTAVRQPEVAHGGRQAQVLGQRPDQGGNRAAFHIEQRPHQHPTPRLAVLFPNPNEL